jgi:hypothetical protein
MSRFLTRVMKKEKVTKKANYFTYRWYVSLNQKVPTDLVVAFSTSVNKKIVLREKRELISEHLLLLD